MYAIQLQGSVTDELYQKAINILNRNGIDAKKIDFPKEENDDTKMTKEEYFAMIDRRRRGKGVEMSMDEMRKFLLED